MKHHSLKGKLKLVQFMGFYFMGFFPQAVCLVFSGYPIGYVARFLITI